MAVPLEIARAIMETYDSADFYGPILRQDFTYPDDADVHPESDYSDQRALYACARVSRAWAAIALPLLWRRPRPRFRQDSSQTTLCGMDFWAVMLAAKGPTWIDYAACVHELGALPDWRLEMHKDFL
ncbi:hypothetical protein HDU88_003996 [Geranomyces variabilis]|nr:hypothetical protein HDU88_003996 [Geranomyces variabilis]